MANTRAAASPSSGEKWKLATFGKIFGLTRQAIINDDLGALADIPAKLGAQAAAFESDYLAALLQSGAGLGPVFADGLPLFRGSARTTSPDRQGQPRRHHASELRRLAERKAAARATAS